MLRQHELALGNHPLKIQRRLSGEISQSKFQPRFRFPFAQAKGRYCRRLFSSNVEKTAFCSSQTNRKPAPARKASLQKEAESQSSRASLNASIRRQFTSSRSLTNPICHTPPLMASKHCRFCARPHFCKANWKFAIHHIFGSLRQPSSANSHSLHHFLESLKTKILIPNSELNKKTASLLNLKIRRKKRFCHLEVTACRSPATHH